MYTIYLVTDRETKQPYYVGVTTQPLANRLKVLRVQGLRSLKDRPLVINPLETTDDREQAFKIETATIRSYKATGHKLLNQVEEDVANRLYGGFAGHHQSDHQKQVMSEIGKRNKGRPRPDLAKLNAERDWSEDKRQKVRDSVNAAMADPTIRAKYRKPKTCRTCGQPKAGGCACHH